MNEPLAVPIALYVHWPFCLAKCPYCDFNSHVAVKIDQERWRRALLTELTATAAEAGPRRLVSIFFGGGTPSLMDPGTVASVIETAASLWTPADDLEVTLEANPTSVEETRFADYADAGVNRLSLGVQSFDDKALSFLGREHTVDAARRALDTARRIFARYSFDLIYARPGQSAAAWRHELAEAIDRAGGHLSLYQLTIEPGTPFFRDRIAGCDDDLGAELYEITQEMTAAAGLPAYEISNHAWPGEACRHNLACWLGVDYAGIGPGAHGRLAGQEGTEAVHQQAAPEAWLGAVETAGRGTAKRRRLSPTARGEELLLSGLRLSKGIDAAVFERRAGVPLNSLIDPVAVARLVEGGFLAERIDGITATPAGLLRLNAVLSTLLLPVAEGGQSN